jgi:four helix bundle protein
MSDFKNLDVWRKAHSLAIDTFAVTGKMRGPGAVHIRHQWLRSAMSVPTNIAEGSGKQSDAEFVRFLRIALGSLTESEYHLILARDLNFVSETHFTTLNDQTQTVGKMLSGLIKALSRRPNAPG